MRRPRSIIGRFRAGESMEAIAESLGRAPIEIENVVRTQLKRPPKRKVKR